MTNLLDQFRRHIAAKPVDALQKLRVELLTRSVGGGEKGPEETGAALKYAEVIQEEIARRTV